MRAPKAERLLGLITVILLGASILIGGRVLYNRVKGAKVTNLSELRGVRLDSILVEATDSLKTYAIPLRGRRTILYQFATDCPYCAAQQLHVGELFTILSIDSSIRVLTASDEPQDVTSEYWSSKGIALRAPLSLSDSTLRAINGYTVPRIYFIDDEAKIISAIQGTIGGWDVQELRRRLQ
jgi:hypothetical protein